MSAECPGCVYGDVREALNDAIRKLKEWLASPHAEMDLDDKASVQRLKDELESSAKRITKAFHGD